jgi:hypothetical protein
MTDIGHKRLDQGCRFILHSDDVKRARQMAAVFSTPRIG